MPGHGWFNVREIELGVTMIAEPGHFQNVKSYLVEGDSKVAVLDSGMGIDDFYDLACTLSDQEPILLLSHAHFDHIGHAYRYETILIHPAEADDLRAGYSNDLFRRELTPDQFRDIPIPAGFDPETAFIPGAEPTGVLDEGDVIDLGGRKLEVHHTPGHSPGGVTLIDPDARLMFPGDAIYEAPMYAHLEHSDPSVYRDTLRKLVMLLPQVNRIYPSHDRVPLAPDDVRAFYEAYEEIWEGRPPDLVTPEREEYWFGAFGFYLPAGWQSSRT